MRERLRSRFIRGMLHAAQHHESRDRADRAKRCYTRLLEIEPAVEDAWLCLVRLHQRQGRHADALASYRRCERVFDKLLGTLPSFTLEPRDLQPHLRHPQPHSKAKPSGRRN